MRAVLPVLALLALAACSAPAPEPPAPEATAPAPAPATAAGPVLPETFPHSMKGYVLYGWVRDGTPTFTLVTGTNRLKTFAELDDPEPLVGDDGWVRVRVTGTEAAADLLRRLPEGEEPFVTSIRHVSVAPTDVPADVGDPDDTVLAALRGER